MSDSIERSIRTAELSLRMEGFSVTDACICQVHIIVSRLTPSQKRSNNTRVCFLC